MSHLVKPSGAGAVVGGDFNSPIANAGASAIHPLDHAVYQWPLLNGTRPPVNFGPTVWQQQNAVSEDRPHNVIDYVVHGPQRSIVALPNCLNQQRWTDILVEFDHAPVLYRITG